MIAMLKVFIIFVGADLFAKKYSRMNPLPQE